MNTQRVHIRLLTVVALGLAVGLRTAAGDEEEVRAWDGVMPDPSQEARAPEGFPPKWFACRIVDEATGKPVPGALWSRTPEWIAHGRARHDAVLSVAVADADGIAVLPADRGTTTDDSHWIALAPGYAGAYEYGRLPPDEMSLEQGEPLRGRVVDALGRPVFGATLHVLGGCSHGTPMALTTTTKDGSFDLGHVLDGQLWVDGGGIEAALVSSSPPSLGGHTTLLAMEPGHRYQGRVVDLLGRPVWNAVVRAYNEQRGPTDVTDAKGRFVLDGVEPGGTLYFFHPADAAAGDAARFVDDARPDVPMRVVLGPLGVQREAETASVIVRARTSEGTPVGDVSFQLVGVDSGRGPDDRTEESPPGDPDDLAVGDARLEVVPGLHRVVPDDPFGRFTFDPVEVRAAADAVATADLRVRPQPRLRIVGELPDSAHATLVVDGASTDVTGTDERESPLPESALAALRVEVEGRPPFFFPVEPGADGVREVRVALPPPRIVDPPAGATDLSLHDGDREAYAFPVGATLATDATGRVTLRWTGKDGTKREAPVDLPPAPGETVRVEEDAGRVVAKEVKIRGLAPDASGAMQDVWSDDASPGEHQAIRREGWRTLRVAVPLGGDPPVVRWGPASLRVVVVDDEGQPVDALVLAGGEIYEAPEGRLELRGFEEGLVRVVVARRGVRGGRETAIRLRAGETTERRIEIPSR